MVTLRIRDRALFKKVHGQGGWKMGGTGWGWWTAWLTGAAPAGWRSGFHTQLRPPHPLLQTDEGETTLYCCYMPTNHVYVGDIYLLQDKDIIRNNLSGVGGSVADEVVLVCVCVLLEGKQACCPSMLRCLGRPGCPCCAGPGRLASWQAASGDHVFGFCPSHLHSAVREGLEIVVSVGMAVPSKIVQLPKR